MDHMGYAKPPRKTFISRFNPASAGLSLFTKILIFEKFGQNADGRQRVNIIHSLSAIILKTYL